VTLDVDFRERDAVNNETSNRKTSSAWLKAPANYISPRVRLGVTPQEFREMGRIGAMYYNRGDLAKARTVFEGLVAMDPASSDAHAALGALLTRIIENDLALEHLNRAIELNDKEIAAYVNRAEIKLRQQQGEAAVVDLKRAIELDPRQKNPAANRARAMVMGIYDALEAKSVM
jgi:tetratricopeptide (TPR) repeat protein